MSETAVCGRFAHRWGGWAGFTQAEADARLAEIEARTADRVNGVDAD